MDPRSNPAHGQGPSQSDYISFWQNLEQDSSKLADFTADQGLPALLTATLPGASIELGFSCPPSESLASSYDNIGIFVEPVDPVDPQTDATAATPPITSAANYPFPYILADGFPDAGQPHTLVQDYAYHSDLTDSASASSPGTPSSKEAFTSRLAKRSMSFSRSSSQRGRPQFRRDSRPPNLHLPSGLTRRELSPLDIFPQQPSLLGPHTEPNLNDPSFDWCSAPNPALLSPSASSTLEIRRKRSSSFRSHRAASVSGPPGSTFLNVPDHSNKSGFTRRRSTSVPSDPTSNFCPTNISPITRPRAYSNSRPRSPAASLTTSPSVSSFEDPQDSNGSGGLPPFQLPPAHGIYNSYDTPSSYQPSPESPFLELDSLNIYTHGNSSASSITSQHSVHSQTSPSPHLPSSEAVDFLLRQPGFDFSNDYLQSRIADDALYHDNNGGGPSIRITNTDDSSAPATTFIPSNDADLGLFELLHPSVFDDSNDPFVSRGQTAPFTALVSSIESAAASPADTLSYLAASPSGDSEQSFKHFDSPAALDYGNLSLAPSFSVHTFSDSQGSNKGHAFTGFEGETRAVHYTLSGNVSGTHPRMSTTAVHEMHGNPNNGSTISETLKHGVRPRALTSIVHVPGAGLGIYPHCDNDILTAEGSSCQSSHTSHHLGNPIVAGVETAAGHVRDGPLHENQSFPHFHSGFSELPALSPTNSMASPAASSSSVRRFSRASSDNNLDPQFEAKKWVYKILTESTSKDKAVAKVIERAREMKWNLIRSVFDDASQRKVKSTPAGQQRAQDRRSRPPTFICILCQSQFTTNNNLQNHYRSHLRMDQYRCPRCGDYFRTEGIRKRHTESAQKCRRLDGP